MLRAAGRGTQGPGLIAFYDREKLGLGRPAFGTLQAIGQVIKRRTRRYILRRVTLCRVIDIIAITTNEFLQDSCPFRFLSLPALAGRPDIIAYPARAAKNVTPVTGPGRLALYLLLPREPGAKSGDPGLSIGPLNGRRRLPRDHG